MTQDEVLVLLNKFQNGDESCLDELLNSFKPMVKSICRGYFLLDGDDEDLIQEGMIGFYKAVQTYNKNQKATFQTFAYLCVLRQVQMAVRKSLRNKQNNLNTCLPISEQGRIVVDTAQNESIYLLSEELNPEEMLIENEQKSILTKQIKSVLSDFEFVVFDLYLQGFSHADIALSTQKDIKSVSNAVARTKEKLKNFFGG